MPIAAFTVNHRCPFKYRKRKSQKEQVPIYTSCKETWKGKKESRNHKIAQNWWSSYYDLFTEREIHTFRTWKATEMFKYSFVMIVFVYVLHNVNMICIFTWNVIACFFLWTWSCFSNFSWCVKRPITYAWNCFLKRYRGPSICIIVSLYHDFASSVLELCLCMLFNSFVSLGCMHVLYFVCVIVIQ